MKKPRLLVTDPDPTFAELYRAYFQTLNYEVVTAVDGLKSVELLHQCQPDVVILSVELAWGGAEGVLAILHEHPLLHKIPVILTVDESHRDAVHRLDHSSIVNVVEKPFWLSDLAFMIDAALRPRVNGHAMESAGDGIEQMWDRR